MRAASIISKLRAALPADVPVDFHTHCTPGYGLASSLMAIINGVDILDTNIWWFGGGSAAPAIELIYIFCKKLGVEMEVNMEAVGRIREKLLDARKTLAAFDLHKDDMQRPFDPLNDKLPAEVDALFDRAIEMAKAGNEDALLEACHAIEKYFGFRNPTKSSNLPKFPAVCIPTWSPSSRPSKPTTFSTTPCVSFRKSAATQVSYLWLHLPARS